MNLHAVPSKTELCRLLLKQRSPLISPSQRAVLIMIDGAKPLRQMSPVLTALGLDDADLDQLTQAGLIQWQDAGGASLRVSARLYAAPPASAPQHRAAGNKSIASAKLYAMDLAGRMLAGQDQRLRDTARHVLNAEQLFPWLESCRLSIVLGSGPERGTLFMDKVLALVPDELVHAHRPSSIDVEI